MTRSTINSLFITLFLASTILFSSSTAQAHDVEPILNPVSAKEVPAEAKGGPRNVIQERTSIMVTQSTVNYLEIVVVDESDTQVHSSETSAYKTNISTEGWARGSYVVITIDAYGDRQDFYIDIE